MKISFICPVYNKIKYLPRVINSIKNQVGDFEKEYIFINDGSNDGSLEFITKETKNWKNKKIISQSNKGPAIATQKGINLSKGDYIKLVGGDDIMSPFCTKLLLDTIVKTSSIAVFSDYELLKSNKRKKFKIETPLLSKIISNPLEKTISSNFSGTTPNLYCAKGVKKSKGCDTRLFIEDYSLVLRLSHYGKFAFINNITCYGPENDKSRIMVSQETQLLHDYNAALFYFIKENRLEKHLIDIACKKCLGRSEKWFRRNIKNSIFTNINLLRLLYYFSISDSFELIRKSCNIFYLNDIFKQKVRYRLS